MSHNNSFNLDMSRIISLNARRKPGDLSLLEKLANIYLQESVDLSSKMVAELNANNIEQLQFFAHSLKSSSRNIGAQRLGEFCEDVEFYCRDNSVDTNLVQLSLLVKEVEDELILVNNLLRQEVERLNT